jgi:hypothetical protein
MASHLPYTLGKGSVCLDQNTFIPSSFSVFDWIGPVISYNGMGTGYYPIKNAEKGGGGINVF